MSSWPSLNSHGAAGRRPSGQRRDADGAGGTPAAARAGSSNGGEHRPRQADMDLELGWRVPSAPTPLSGPGFPFVAPPQGWMQVPVSAPRPDGPFLWGMTMPGRPEGVPPVHGGWWRPAAMQGDSGEGAVLFGRSSHPAVLEPVRDARENASTFAVSPLPTFAAVQRWTHAPVFASRPDVRFPSSMPGRLDGVSPIHGAWGSEATHQGDSGIRAAFPGTSFHPGVLEPERDADGRASCLPLAKEVGHRAARQNASNFVLSPLSFHAALALVAAGARGETQRELLAFLGLETPAELHHAAATELVGRLRDLPQTSFACGIWVSGHTSRLRPEFMDTATSRYAAVAESADFAGSYEEERQRINTFVSDATNGLITDVLPPGSVDPSTTVVLANALYFKGTWALPFDRSRTFLAPFHLPDGGTVRAPFMTTNMFEQQIAVFPGFRALKLPYKNDTDPHQAAAFFYMLLLLPDGEAHMISDLYEKIVSTPGFIRKHTPVGEVPVGRFMVPKFKFTFEFEASEDMKKLGVARAFGAGDFSGMVTVGGNGLFISGVYHKATIEVDEEGTVAAAATVVCLQDCARAPRPPVDFVANRPFLFAIVEQRTGAVMFIGHVMNPVA